MSTSEPSARTLAPDAPPELADFVDCLNEIHREHPVSFVLAGADRIYAYGTHDYKVVLSERVFDALVEVETPAGDLRIEPNVDGLLDVTPPAESDRAAAGRMLGDTTRELRNYYARRYWNV